jgi:DNA adenine methylase
MALGREHLRVRPFLKWAGGKRWLTKQLSDHFPRQFNNYIEPFLGSGAIFFEMLPKNALLSDSNEALISTYRTIRRKPKEIHDALIDFQKNHSAELYYKTRSAVANSDVEAAARFIYLNRTCWNGLYRVNQNNQFNVPKGTKDTIIFPDDDFNSISEALASVELRVGDFEVSIDRGAVNDLIYVDPPYTVKHNNNGFVKYNQTIFSWDDQIRLHDSLVRARDRGCHVVISNANHKSIKELYAGFGSTRSLPRSSVIAGASKARGQTTELLVVHHG